MLNLEISNTFDNMSSSVSNNDDHNNDYDNINNNNNIAPTMSEEEQQGRKVPIHGDISSFPRSIRWRIQLGILRQPPPQLTPPTTSTNTNHTTLQQQSSTCSYSNTTCQNNNGGNSDSSGDTTAGSSNGVWTLDEILECNRPLVSQWNLRFKELVEKYFEESEKDVNHIQLPQSDNDDNNNNNNHNVTPDLDPLTAMVMEQQAQDTRKAELYTKYRKERARMKRGLSIDDRVVMESESDSDQVDRASVRIASLLSYI
jgi:hypothetical protein